MILDGALQIGAYAGGVLFARRRDGGRASWPRGTRGGRGADRPAPPALLTRQAPAASTWPAAERAASARRPRRPQALYLVPLATPDVHVGTLALLDPDGESPDDRLMEAYASRAAAAWRPRRSRHGRSASSTRSRLIPVRQGAPMRARPILAVAARSPCRPGRHAARGEVYALVGGAGGHGLRARPSRTAPSCCATASSRRVGRGASASRRTRA